MDRPAILPHAPVPRRGRRLVAGAAGLFALLWAGCAFAAPPVRVVSANLCADRLTLALADPGQVISASTFGADPLVSTVADRVRSLPLNRGSAEEIMSFHPDLVVAGAFNDPATVRLLRRVGVPVFVLADPATLEGVEGAIRDLATALGHPERGQALAAKLAAGLTALPPASAGRRAVIYQAGGLSAGTGTLADALLKQAGLVNVAAKAGLQGFGTFSLESLVKARPDRIIIEEMGGGGPSLALSLLDHPVLVGIKARVIHLPARLWSCPDGALIDAARLMAEDDR